VWVIKKSPVVQAEQDGTQARAAASGSKKLLAMIMLVVVAVNLFLFLKFGLQRKLPVAPPAPVTNSPAAMTATNVPSGNSAVRDSISK